MKDKCMFYDECKCLGVGLCDNCIDYSPIEEEEGNIELYNKVLKENISIYQGEIDEYK